MRYIYNIVSMPLYSMTVSPKKPSSVEPMRPGLIWSWSTICCRNCCRPRCAEKNGRWRWRNHANSPVDGKHPMNKSIFFWGGGKTHPFGGGFRNHPQWSKQLQLYSRDMELIKSHQFTTKRSIEQLPKPMWIGFGAVYSRMGSGLNDHDLDVPLIEIWYNDPTESN